MNSDNLTDAINFELFKSGMDSFVSQYCMSINELIKSSQIFFKEMKKYWASERATFRCNSMKEIIIREIEDSLTASSIFCYDIQSVAKDWAKALASDGLTGYNQIMDFDRNKDQDAILNFKGKYSQDTGSGVLDYSLDGDDYTWLIEDPEYGTGMRKVKAQGVFDEYISTFSKHIELLDGLSSINFGLRDSSGTIEAEIKALTNRLKELNASRIEWLGIHFGYGCNKEVDNVMLGEDSAEKSMEGN